MKLLGNHLLVLDRRERRRLIAYATSFIVAAVAFPIGWSIYLARDQGLETEKERALNYAGDALRRSEATFEQIATAFDRLKRLDQSSACSPPHLSLMRQIDLASSHIQAIGRMQGNVLVCSSMGSELSAVDLGPVELVQSSGLRIRTQVRFPFAPKERFIAVERDGYAAIIHRDLPIDATTEVKDVSFAITFSTSPFVMTSRGTLKKEWLQPLPPGTRKTMVEDDYVVAVVSSPQHQLQAMSAVPSANLHHRLEQYALVLIPLGLLVALITGACALHLARQRTSMRSVMNSALKRNEFFLEYQPIVDLHSSRWVGAEALIRWRRASGETVRPDRFIPVAEEHGLSQWISRRVMELVAADARDFFREFPDFYISINLTAADLHDANTTVMLRELAEATGAGPGNLAVEATERFMTEAAVANEIVRMLHRQGVPVSIDDFGTGYSSLSCLEQLEADALKIDKSFIDTLNRNAVTSNVVLHIIEMAKALGIGMVAEGVETREQADYLLELGVQNAQGWHFARPMAFSSLKARLRKDSSAALARQA